MNVRLWHALGMGPFWRERGSGSLPLAGAAPDHPPAAALAPQSVGLAAQPPPPASDWEGLQEAVAGCTACGLCRTRTQTVFGVGQRSAHWLFIGEAPGAEEDARGEPFVGQAGRLLDNMLAAAGLGRDRDGAEGAYIANVLKCRPPGNRNPEPAEIAACTPFLQRQIALLQPRIVVLMGRFAVQAVLGTDAAIGSLRGRVHELGGGAAVSAAGSVAVSGIGYASGSAIAAARMPAVVTYHPAYLLRNLAEKAKSWDDLCLAREAYSAVLDG